MAKIRIRSKKTALTAGWELWDWLAKNPTEEKIDWPGWNRYASCECECPCCQYHITHKRSYCNKNCIVPWPGGGCGSNDSPYDKWEGLSPYREALRRKYAREVANLHKKALKALK